MQEPSKRVKDNFTFPPQMSQIRQIARDPYNLCLG
jgi:hypothetical protein